jgi:hypothetical protein
MAGFQDRMSGTLAVLADVVGRQRGSFYLISACSPENPEI